MNVQAHMSGQISGQVPNQGTMSQQNVNSQIQNLVGAAAAAAPAGAGLGPSRVSPVDSDIHKLRQAMRMRIFNILQQKQPSPADEASTAKYMDVARRLEEGLFKIANTKEDYMNQATLEPRLASIIKGRQLSNYNQRHANSSAVGTMIPTPGLQHRFRREKAMLLKTEVDEVSSDMINGVSSDDTSLQLESAAKIRSILSQRNITFPSEIVIRSGVVPRLVQFLCNEDFPKLQYEAAWVLTNIATEKPDVVVDRGAIPVLVQLLASPKDYVREQALWALSNVADDSIHYRDFVLECGLLMPLLNLLYKDTTLKIATWTLCNLCRGRPPPAFDQVKPALPALELLLYSNDEEVLKHACLALFHLSDGSEDGIQSVIEAGFVPKLVEFLQHPSSVVLVLALRIIGTIVAGTNQQTQCVINCGALPILCNLLARNYENNIKKHACWAISNITAGTNEQIQLVIDANLIPTLVNLAQNAEFDMKKEAVWAISNVTLRASHDQIKYMVEQSCIKPLCDILLCPDLRTILKCLDGLENILKAGEAEKNTGDVNCYSQLIEDAKGLKKIENLRNHENSVICEEALKILERYWLEEDDEETQTTSKVII